jgi:hypothetical protein
MGMGDGRPAVLFEKDSVVLTGAEALARYRCVLSSHSSK